jgi:hypothetical protein
MFIQCSSPLPFLLIQLLYQSLSTLHLPNPQKITTTKAETLTIVLLPLSLSPPDIRLLVVGVAVAEFPPVEVIILVLVFEADDAGGADDDAEIVVLPAVLAVLEGVSLAEVVVSCMSAAVYSPVSIFP